jgi:hypothetical protein
MQRDISAFSLDLRKKTGSNLKMYRKFLANLLIYLIVIHLADTLENV